LSALAVPTGAVCALLAVLLQRLIGLFTNLFYYGSFEIPLELVSAQTGVGRLLVVAPDNLQRLVGIVTRSDLLKGRTRYLEEEAKRERFFVAAAR
jgi:hypothetical protein